jgi:Domain of unknown function (DUF4189)
VITQLNRLDMFPAMVALISGQTSDNRPHKYLGSTARFILPCLLAIVCCWLPDAVSAEGRCPPGMFETGSRDFIACAPMPGYDQSGDGGSADQESPYRRSDPIRPSKPGFTATAYHADTASVWTSAGHHTLDAAKKRVLNDCDAATGGGCYVAEVLERAGAIYVTEDAMGQLWVKQDDNKEARRFDVTKWNPSIAHCLKNSFGCKFLGVHESGYIYLDEPPERDQSANRYPKGKLGGMRWAMVAQPVKTSSTSAQNKSWLISGKRNSAASRKEILDRCQAESGMPCAISAYAVNSEHMAADSRKAGGGLLVHFIDWRGHNRWISAALQAEATNRTKGEKVIPDPVTAQGRIDRICPPELRCKIVATYDAGTPRMQVIEDAS